MIGGPTNALSVEGLREKVAQLGLSDVVTVTGRIDEAEKNRLLSDIDIFLYPSRHDLAPLSLIEALSHACVPIVFKTGGIPEIVGSKLSANVLPVSMNETEFSKAVGNIVSGYLTDKNLLARDSKFARTQFLTDYSEPEFRKNILALLDRDGSSDCNSPVDSPRFLKESIS